MRRWLREWQVREGRVRPRSARERAIAATGGKERQAATQAPEPPPARLDVDIAVKAEDMRSVISEGIARVSRRQQDDSEVEEPTA